MKRHALALMGGCVVQVSARAQRKETQRIMRQRWEAGREDRRAQARVDHAERLK